MSKVLKRILILSLALILSFTFAGCAQGESAETDVGQILANSAIATVEADTCKFDMDMLIDMEVVGEPQPIDMTMVADITAVVSNISQEMQMTMDMTMDTAGQAEQEMTMDMSMEVYVVGEWMYMKLDIPMLGEQWMKMRLTEELWEEQNLLEQQIQLLTAPVETNLMGAEEVSGTACYVVEITPNMETFSNWLSQQQAAGLEDMDWEELDLADLFKELSYKCWIAKDGYLLMKAEIYLLMEITPKDVEAAEGEFEKMTMDMNMEMKLYDYNQKVSIELPPEALGATEMPGGT